MWHPFDYLRTSWRIALLVIFFVLTLIVARNTNQPLKPFRIVALELAPTVEAAQIIIDSWKKTDPKLDAAHKLQYWDNFLIVCYSTFLALACVLVTDWLFAANTTANFLGKLFTWLMWVAGILDYVENYAINKMLAGSIEKPWPAVSSIFASLKFMIIGAGIVYILSGIVVGLLHLKRSR